MLHIDNIILYVYQYQLCVHVIGCATVIALALATGVRPARSQGHGSRASLTIGALFLFIQIPITLLRMNATVMPEFSVNNPLHLYINFAWSPMCTVCLLWLYLSHVVSSCGKCGGDVPAKNINPSPEWPMFGCCIVAGIGTSYLIHEWLAVVLLLDDMWILHLLFGIALAGAPMEILFFRARKNELRFFNYTWAWFLGTWLFFLPKV